MTDPKKLDEILARDAAFMSRHQKHRYVRVVIDGQRVTMEPGPAIETLEQQEGCAAEDVWLTRVEFEALPEFEG